MAKGRKLTTSRSERYLGSYSYGHSQGNNVTDLSELGEEDVWSMVDDVTSIDEQNPRGEWTSRASSESNGSLSTMSRRRISPETRHLGGLSLAFDGMGNKTAASPRIVQQFRGNDSVASHHMATSAPMNVPDWGKILRVDSVESLHDSDDGMDDGDAQMVPPHEYLAREYARSKRTGGGSVFEGVGRTLKGRDMWRVRDAVWSQTGFNG
ncbi:Senescence_reg domain-containing protein [Cephalotus follicularis]|uniref:Senescence_reg domain-containing protein n=1 Tax=Cephalotus follicularis TaxID=3775 RepID=A0A1Q3BVB3_CEPFO|nr:Senescence_reg domain-containing protein [Cephalotus follicularis]